MMKKMFDRFVATVLSAAMIVQPMMAQTVITDTNGNSVDAGSGNGVPLFLIGRPDANGVSHNIFGQFDVGTEGLILNNNATTSVVSTQLGGLIIPNGNVTGNAASLILNEVTGANPSVLLGAIEVGGTQADVIVANPYGITCNGCGFINTGNLTLTTGTPTWTGNAFTGFSVDDGAISIGANGLDASQTLAFSLISRQLDVGGSVVANDINVILGRNDVVYITGEVTEKADDGGAKPTLSIDSSLLGGMYAGKIAITSTEDGVGARMPENMAANAGGMRLTADGRLVIGNSSSGGNVRVTATGPVDVTGDLAAANLLAVVSLDGFNVASTGSAVGDGGVTISAASLLAESGAEIVSGTTLLAEIDGAFVTEGGSKLTAAGDVTVTAASVNNGGTLAASGGDLIVSAADNILNSGIAYGADSLRFRTDDVIENNDGTILSDGNVTLGGLTTARASAVLNLDGGLIEATGGNIAILAGTILNASTAPDTSAADVTGTPDATGNTCPVGFTCDTSGLVIDATLPGSSSQIIASGNITLTGTDAENRYSLISAGGNVVLNLTTLENVGLGLYATTADPTVLEQVGAVFGVIEAAGVIDANVSGYILNGSVNDNVAYGGGTGSVDPAALASDLTSNDLLVTVDDPNAPYLIETRPEFTDPEQFLSSDYFLIAVGLDPAEAQKRLGDAYAELLYIRKQLLALAGLLRLQPGVDEVEQIRRMYDNAVDAQADLDLVVGVALTPEQQAALKTDIIWMEEITVNGQTVLAPRVYLADTTRIQLAGGAILRGALIDVTTTDFANTGTLYAEGAIKVKASGDLYTSGRIEGGNVLLSGENLTIATDSDRRGDEIIFADGTYGQAEVISRGDMVLKASQDLVIAGASIEADRNLSVIAGNGLAIVSPTFERRSGQPTGANHNRKEDVLAMISRLRAGGDIALIAEGADGLLLAGADIGATGTLMVIARTGDLTMAAVQDIRFRDKATKKSGFLGFSKKITRDQVLTVDNIPVRLAASQIGVIADTAIMAQATDFTIPGTLETKGNLAVLSVNSDVAFTHVSDIRAEHHYKKRSIFWGLIQNTRDLRTLYTEAMGSTGQITGDMFITAAGDLTLTAVDYKIDGAFTTDVGGATYVLSAVEMSHRALTYHKDNGIIVTDHRSESIRETAKHNSIDAAGGVYFDEGSPIVFGAVRDDFIDSTHPGNWTVDSGGRLALASALLGDVTENEATGNDDDAPGHWREDFSWAEKGNLTKTMMELPGAEDGAGYAYIPGLLARDTTVVIPTELISYSFSETHRSISPAFMALVSIAVGQWVGSWGFVKGIESAFWQGFAKASISSMITQTAAGVVSGDLDLGKILKGAVFAGLGAGLTASIDLGAVMGASNDSLLGIAIRPGETFGILSPHAILDGLGDALVNASLSVIQNGGSFGDAFLGSFTSFMSGQVLAATHVGVGDLGLTDGSLGHVLIHGVVGCAFAEASGGDCRAGFMAAAAQSLYAGYAERNDIDFNEGLNNAELIGAFTGYLFSGGKAENVSLASQIATSAFKNNYLTHTELVEFERKLTECIATAGDCQKIIDHYARVSKFHSLEFQNCGEDAACLAFHINQMTVAKYSGIFNKILAMIQPDMDPANSALALASIEAADQAFAHRVGEAGLVDVAAATAGSEDEMRERYISERCQGDRLSCEREYYEHKAHLEEEARKANEAGQVALDVAIVAATMIPVVRVLRLGVSGVRALGTLCVANSTNCARALAVEAAYLTYEGDGSVTQGLREIDTGVTQAVGSLASSVYNLGQTYAPRLTNTVVSAVAVAGAALDEVAEAWDNTTGNVVSSTWNSLGPDTQSTLRGATMLLGLVVAGAELAAARIGSTVVATPDGPPDTPPRVYTQGDTDGEAGDPNGFAFNGERTPYFSLDDVNAPEGTVFDGTIYRYENPERVETTFDAHPGNIAADHRYSEPGQGAVYGGTSGETAFAEISHYGAETGRVLVQQNVRLENVLDLTNPAVRAQIGVRLDQITGDSYQLTHQIGNWAKANGYDGILAPSARDPAGANLVVLKP